MRNITIDLGVAATHDDMDVLRSTLKNLTSKDELIIRMEAADAHQTGWLTDELDREGFDYQPHGGSGADFYFIARKKS